MPPSQQLTESPIDAMDTHRFRAETVEEALADARAELGPDIEVVEASRIRRGGVGGFFATDLGVEVVVATASPAPWGMADVTDRIDDSGDTPGADADEYIDSTQIDRTPTSRPVRSFEPRPLDPRPHFYDRVVEESDDRPSPARRSGSAPDPQRTRPPSSRGAASAATETTRTTGSASTPLVPPSEPGADVVTSRSARRRDQGGPVRRDDDHLRRLVERATRAERPGGTTGEPNADHGQTGTAFAEHLARELARQDLVDDLATGIETSSTDSVGATGAARATGRNESDDPDETDRHAAERRIRQSEADDMRGSRHASDAADRPMATSDETIAAMRHDDTIGSGRAVDITDDPAAESVDRLAPTVPIERPEVLEPGEISGRRRAARQSADRGDEPSAPAAIRPARTPARRASTHSKRDPLRRPTELATGAIGQLVEQFAGLPTGEGPVQRMSQLSVKVTSPDGDVIEMSVHLGADDHG